MAVVSGSWDTSVCIWGSKTRELVASPFQGHHVKVHSVAFSPQGRGLSPAHATGMLELGILDCRQTLQTSKDILCLLGRLLT